MRLILQLFTHTIKYLVPVLVPYIASMKTNDANILQYLVKTNSENKRDWPAENEWRVVDRGVCDSIDFLKENGVVTFTPSFCLKTNPSIQPNDDEEPNDGRLATKVRWLVEAANDRINQWIYAASTL